MFTLKFVRCAKDFEQTRVVCTRDYTVIREEEKDVYSIAVQNLVNETGTTFFCTSKDRVSIQGNVFDVCYIENEAGKTIDCIQAGL